MAVINGASLFAEANNYKANLSWIKTPTDFQGELKIKYEGDAEFSGQTFSEDSIMLKL